MEKLSQKKQIKKEVIKFFNLRKNRGLSQFFYGSSLISYVNNRLGLYKFSDTPLRYMRELRDAGKIDYETINRKKSLYKIK